MNLPRVKIIAIAFTVALLTACASGPTQEQLASASYGRDMQPTECAALAERVVADGLKDPNSAQFRHTTCFKGYWGSVPLRGMSVQFGWVQKGEVNAKNSFGGYVGFRPYQVLVRDGEVIRYCVSDKDGICMPMGR